MPRLLHAILCILSFATIARAQERKIEIFPFAGGYFNSGYRGTGGINIFGRTETSGEPNTGIFGVRGSHEITRSLALEGTFAVGPTARTLHRQLGGSLYTDIEDFLTGTISLSSATNIGNSIHYSGSILYELSDRDGWAAFFAAGAGVVTRGRRQTFYSFVFDPPETTNTFESSDPDPRINLTAC